VPNDLPSGTYEAKVTLDAGPFKVDSTPLTLKVLEGK
jgi:hypothetical protein